MSRSVLTPAWLVVGAAMVAVPVWLAATRGSVLLAGHPVTVALAAAGALLGLVALAWAVTTLVRRGASGSAAGWRRVCVRRAGLRTGLAALALGVGVLLAAVLAWARPLAATAPALAALRPGAEVRVTHRPTWYELTPAARDDRGDLVRPTTGLVFVPGARVDARAYAALLRPLAQAGYLVTVLKAPLGVALLAPGQPAAAIEAHPEVTRWVVGGHSLGGVSAASFADAHRSVGPASVAGLVLWAAYPAQRMTRTELAVASVAGERDGLTTPQDVEESRGDLPVDARVTVVPGAVHATFGDYGAQDGDGVPTGDRGAQQATISAATEAVLATVAR